MNSTIERRKNRSQDPLVALHYQLSHVRSAHGLDAVVLADTSGFLVAGAGAWATCEEIAAYAPLLAERGPDSSPRIAKVAGELDVQSLPYGDESVYLCASGKGGGADMTELARGISRILSMRAA